MSSCFFIVTTVILAIFIVELDTQDFTLQDSISSVVFGLFLVVILALAYKIKYSGKKKPKKKKYQKLTIRKDGTLLD